MKLSNTDLKLFSKQIVLKKVGVSGQKKLLKSKVLIVGMGGLGCPLLLYLVSSGVGEIGIADHDKVELSNLNRQTLFNSNDIGKYKVNQAKSKVSKITIMNRTFEKAKILGERFKNIEVKKWAENRNVKFKEHPTNGVFRKLNSRGFKRYV